MITLVELLHIKDELANATRTGLFFCQTFMIRQAVVESTDAVKSAGVVVSVIISLE